MRRSVPSRSLWRTPVRRLLQSGLTPPWHIGRHEPLCSQGAGRRLPEAVKRRPDETSLTPAKTVPLVASSDFRVQTAAMLSSTPEMTRHPMPPETPCSSTSHLLIVPRRSTCICSPSLHVCRMQRILTDESEFSPRSECHRLSLAHSAIENLRDNPRKASLPYLNGITVSVHIKQPCVPRGCVP